MTLIRDGEYCFFAERDAQREKTPLVRLPDEGVLILNGCYRFSSKDKRVKIAHGLKEGENTLCVRLGGRVYPCESLWAEGDTVKALGFSLDERMVSLFYQNRTLQKRLDQMETRLCLLEKACAPRKIF